VDFRVTFLTSSKSPQGSGGDMQGQAQLPQWHSPRRPRILGFWSLASTLSLKGFRGFCRLGWSSRPCRQDRGQSIAQARSGLDVRRPSECAAERSPLCPKPLGASFGAGFDKLPVLDQPGSANSETAKDLSPLVTEFLARTLENQAQTALADNETVDFIRRQGKQAEYTTSVCVGAFLLGAAGLLKGRRATTHWAYVDLLSLVGARHEKGRVVRDGNVFTAGGVTSGIDFAFHIVAELAGPEVAQAIQLGIEYDPSPPFDGGHPDKATQAATALMVQRNQMAHTGIRQNLENLAIVSRV
jgi:hypothetical protein